MGGGGTCPQCPSACQSSQIFKAAFYWSAVSDQVCPLNNNYDPQYYAPVCSFALHLLNTVAVNCCVSACPSWRNPSLHEIAVLLSSAVSVPVTEEIIAVLPTSSSLNVKPIITISCCVPELTALSPPELKESIVHI